METPEDKPDLFRTETEIRQKIRKSNVRIVVTYFVVFVYCTTAVVLTFVLLYLGKVELALGVFSGLSTLSAGIAGFWFGNRSTGYPETMVAPGGSSDEGASHQIDFDPILGEARRPSDPGRVEKPAVFPATREGGAGK